MRASSAKLRTKSRGPSVKRGVVAFALGFVLGAKGLKWGERFIWALIILYATVGHHLAEKLFAR